MNRVLFFVQVLYNTFLYTNLCILKDLARFINHVTKKIPRIENLYVAYIIKHIAKLPDCKLSFVFNKHTFFMLHFF